MKKILIILIVLLTILINGVIPKAFSMFSNQKNVDEIEAAPNNINGGNYLTDIYINDVDKVDFASYIKNGYHDITWDIEDYDWDFPVEGDYIVKYEAKNSKNVKVKFNLNITIWSFNKFSTGDYHVLGLTNNGDIYSWGRNNYGQLGHGDSVDRLVPTKINTTLKFKTISTTSNSSFAIDENNVVWCWGANDNGVTGTCQAVQNTPVKLNNPSNIKLVSLAGGAPSTMGGITSSGDLYSWGNGTKGGLGNGVDSTNNPTMTKITFSNPILSVEFGKNGGLILDRNRDVWGFGTNEYGELGLSDLSIKNRVPTKISSLSNIMGIVADINIRMALSTNGVAYSWGDTTNNRTGFSANSGVKYTPTVISNSAMSIASSKTHSAILSTSGNAIIFGLNQYGQNGSHNNNATNSNYTFNPGFYIENIYLLDSTTLMYSNYDLYSIGAGWYGVMGNNNNTTNQYNDTKKWILNSLNNIPTITLKIIKNLKEEELSKIL